MEKRKVKCGGYGMFTGIYGIVGLGILFGILLGIPFKPAEWTLSDVAAVLATGMALAYVVLAAIDWLVQTIALAKNPLPADLDLSDRSVARERVAALTGCALFHSWHWEKKGASEAEYSFDEAQCKAKVYSGTDGMVTNASVRRMHGCMEAKGWVKVPN